ncbi:hypothetical protein QQ045_014992 [Rhodiola kirilowii]
MKRKRTDLQKDTISVRGGGGRDGVSTVPDPNRPQPDPNNDGANIQVQPRRKRGRPLGSTSKPKSPATITCKPDPVMSPYILEVADGVDVIAAIATFSRRHNIFLGILFASGAFSSITTLEPPHPSTFPNISYSRTTHGRFDILSLAAVWPVFYDRRSNTLPAQVGDLNVATTVRDNYGRMIGGIVTGPLIASGIVYVIVSSFTRPTYHRLFVGDQDEDATTSSGRNEQQGPSAAPGDQNNNAGGGASGGAVAMSNRNEPTYGIWRACK